LDFFFCSCTNSSSSDEVSRAFSKESTSLSNCASGSGDSATGTGFETGTAVVFCCSRLFLCKCTRKSVTTLAGCSFEALLACRRFFAGGIDFSFSCFSSVSLSSGLSSGSAAALFNEIFLATDFTGIFPSNFLRRCKIFSRSGVGSFLNFSSASKAAFSSLLSFPDFFPF